MRIFETSSTGEEPRNVQRWPSHKRAATVFAMLGLTIACILTGMPAATAATAATAPTVSLPGRAGNIFDSGAKGRYITYVTDSSVLACEGECPGLCPCPYAFKGDETLDT